jgi:hypothetical protein
MPEWVNDGITYNSFIMKAFFSILLFTAAMAIPSFASANGGYICYVGENCHAINGDYCGIDVVVVTPQ